MVARPVSMAEIKLKLAANGKKKISSSIPKIVTQIKRVIRIFIERVVFSFKELDISHNNTELRIRNKDTAYPYPLKLSPKLLTLPMKGNL